MAKVQQKSEKITAFGWNIFRLGQIQHLLQQTIQTYLGTRIKQHPSLML